MLLISKLFILSEIYITFVAKINSNIYSQYLLLIQYEYRELHSRKGT